MRLPAVSALLSLLLVSSAPAAVIDLSAWSVVQYELLSQPDANWILSSGNTVATQTVNADASILLSDFDATNTVINGSWEVPTNSDDDFMGFVFGYQNRGQYYLFDWKQGDQADPLGFAERGMSIKIVNVPGAADPGGSDLWPTAGSSRVTSLFHNQIPWNDSTLYHFHLDFRPGRFKIEVKQGSTTLFSETIIDNTFQSGKFGFYNYSQGPVRYQGFTVDPAPIPEPSPFALLSLGLLGGWAGYSWQRGSGKTFRA